MTDHPTLLAATYWIYIACLLYFVCVTLYYLVLFVFAALENRLRVRQQLYEDFHAISLSRHTLPVSVVIPAYNEEQTISDCLYSLVKLNYPEYEIITVNDGSKDRTLEVLIEEFKLVQADIFSRRHFEMAEVKAVYRSTIHKELYVIDKANGGKADALNCGINFSRYPYICTADADTVFAPDSLLKGMRVVLRDPQKVVAVGSLIGISNGCVIEKGSIKEFGLPRERVVALQFIEYLRSFLVNRLAWSRLNFVMVVSGAFAIYRRDLLVELGGFSEAFTCEDIEMTFRVQEYMRKKGRSYRILCLPEAVSWTEAPHTWKNLYHQRHRWQRVICETVWHYKGMILNPRYGKAGLIGMPYYLLEEALPWVPEIAALALIPLGIYLGVFSWEALIVFLGIFGLTGVLISALGILLQDTGFRTLSRRELVRLILLSFIEPFGYRQLVYFSRLAGTVAFLRGEKGWQKFSRVEREEDFPQEREAAPETGSTEPPVQIPKPAAEKEPIINRRDAAYAKGEDVRIMSIFRRSKPKTDENAEVDERMAPTPAGQLPEPVSVLDPKALSEIIDRLRDLGEIVSSVGDYRKKLDRESEAVSNFVQELGEYVEKVSSRRSKLEEDARKLNELCDKLEQETTEVSALRNQIEEKVSRIHELLDRYQSE